MHRVGVGKHRRDERVACLVVAREFLLLLRKQMALALRTEHHLLYGADKVILCDLLAILARRKNSAFVHKRVELGAREAGRALRDHCERHIRAERLLARMNLQNLFAVAAIGQVDSHAPVKAAGAQKSGVKDIRPIRRRHHHNLLGRFKTVHLHEYLVEGLLALVVASANPRATHASDRINLINEDDGGRGLLRQLEEVAHAAGADTDKHLHELRTADGEEGHACLAGDGARKKGLTGARGTQEDDALGDARADVKKFLWILEEVYDFKQFLLRLARARDVGEGDALCGVVGIGDARLRLPETEGLHPRALHLPREEPEEEYDKKNRK